MIFQHIDFHNVDDIIPYEDGWMLRRFPRPLLEEVNPGLRDNACGFNSGVELRFRMKGEGVTLLLRSLPIAEAQVAHIYYGSFQGGWENSARMIGTQTTRIHRPAPKNKALLESITREQQLTYSMDVVRVLLPYGKCVYLGCEGEVEPPHPGDTPARTILNYGSSITHGSLALDTPHTYAFRMAQLLGTDYLNKGCAGTAHAEKAMAEYITADKSWDLCTVELGINMLHSFEPDAFERQIDQFTAILAEDPRPVFATSIFHYNGDDQARGRLYRDIVRKYAGERLIFTDGLELLENPAILSQDLVHPSIEGQEQIARRWAEIIRSRLD